MEIQSLKQDISDELFERTTEKVTQLISNITNDNDALQMKIMAHNERLQERLEGSVNEAINKLEKTVISMKTKSTEQVLEMEQRLGEVEKKGLRMPKIHIVVLYVMILFLVIINVFTSRKAQMVLEREQKIEQVLLERFDIHIP